MFSHIYVKAYIKKELALEKTRTVETVALLLHEIYRLVLGVCGISVPGPTTHIHPQRRPSVDLQT